MGNHKKEPNRSAEGPRAAKPSALEEYGSTLLNMREGSVYPVTPVVYNHAQRDALAPVLTVVGLQFGAVLAGAIVNQVSDPSTDRSRVLPNTRPFGLDRSRHYPRLCLPPEALHNKARDSP